MDTELTATTRPFQPAGEWPGQDMPGYPMAEPALFRERVWRQVPIRPGSTPDTGSILASRWTDERTTSRIEHPAPAGHYVIGVALRPAQIRLGFGVGAAYEGIMPTGMVYVTGPGQAAAAESSTPCDFIHFHVAADALRGRQAASMARVQRPGSAAAEPRSLHGLLVRDDLAAQLSRTLTDDQDGGDPLYVESVGQTILMPILALRTPTPRVGALPKWRLQRVREHLAANLSEPISLADLADAAGLSRMHFAAQFRVATGCRPHDYVLQQHIEAAKQMLAGTKAPLVEIALSVGFQTQSHFSTVFKRLAGDTPARWQRSRRAA